MDDDSLRQLMEEVDPNFILDQEGRQILSSEVNRFLKDVIEWSARLSRNRSRGTSGREEGSGITVEDVRVALKELYDIVV